jgi:lipopolysaccharide export system permease protein
MIVSNPKFMTVTLRLIDGSIHAVDSKLEKYKKTDFSSYDINLDMNNTVQGGGTISKGSVDMTVAELLKNIERQDLPPDRIRDMMIELYKKISIPLSCVVFAILAVPFGIVNNRSGKSRGFTVGLSIAAFYYTLQLAGEALGETGRIPPLIAVWTPNAVLGAAGLYLFILAAGERSVMILKLSDWADLLADRLKRRRP